ncbi:MAG: hypothetical protein AAB836_01500 [Patescibacteria group bacterium]
MSELEEIFQSEFTEENQKNLLRALNAGLLSLETRLPTNLKRDGLAADDFCMELMTHRTAELPLLAKYKPEFVDLYKTWVEANRKRIDTVLLRL